MQPPQKVVESVIVNDLVHCRKRFPHLRTKSIGSAKSTFRSYMHHEMGVVSGRALLRTLYNLLCSIPSSLLF